MHAADVMTRPVLTVRADDYVEQAAALLANNTVTAAPVLDREGGLVGIVSEGDLMRRPEAYLKRRLGFRVHQIALAQGRGCDDSTSSHGDAGHPGRRHRDSARKTQH